MRPRLALLAILTLATTACAELSSPTSTRPPGATASTTSITIPATTTPPPPDTGCGSEPTGWVTSGPVAIVGAPDSDASQISSVGVFASGVCERFEVGLVTDGFAPATSAPETSVEILPDAGIVRLQFTGRIASTAITDSLIESELVREAYVVRGLNGSLFVDVHLAAPVAARAIELRNPARVGVELRPGGDPPGLGAASADNVVVTAPAQRVIEYPFVVEGYARTFEANVIARLSVDGSAVAEQVTTAADWLETWGEFRIEIADGPGGDTALFVGEDSARDGTPQGVTLELNAG